MKSFTFKDDVEKPFYNPTSKKAIVWLLIFVGAAIIAAALYLIFFFAFVRIILGIAAFGIFYHAWMLSMNVAQTRKWKKGIDDYLENISKFNIYKVTLSENALSLIMDDEETITKWSEFTTAKINPDFIDLKGDTYYFFPKKSMNPEEFDYFKNVVSDKMKKRLSAN